MYFFEENEHVIYKGDFSSLNDLRREPSLAIVEEIDENKYPHVNIRLLPSNELIGVSARNIRIITTTG